MASMRDRRELPAMEGWAFQTAWHDLGREGRRRIVRAVRRGQALDNPVDAAFAVGFARQEQAPWKWWLLAFQGPFLAFQIWIAREYGHGVFVWLLSAVLVVTAGALLWLIRARRRARAAEQRNLLALDERP